MPSPGTEFDCFIHLTLFISRLAKKFNQFLVAIFAFASIWNALESNCKSIYASPGSQYPNWELGGASTI